MQRTIFRSIWIAATLLLWHTAVHAERELEFAKGLTDKGFYDLAVEQYQLLEADAKASADDRAQASLQLADCYAKAADASTKPEQKDDLLGKAAEQLGKFLKTYKARPEVGDARFRVAILNQQRALDKDKLLQATQDAKLQAKLKEEATKLFTEAANTFGDMADDLEKKVSKDGPKYVDKGKPDEAAQKTLERYLLARGQMGWTYYYLSQVYSHDPKDKDKMKKELMEAQNVFQPFLKEYPNYYISLWVQCGQGLVYRGLGDFEKSADEFRRVTMKRRTEEANPIRHQAYYWLTETYRMAKMYDDSIRTANRFIAEVPETYGAPIADAIKLEKAKSYAEQAEVYKKDKKDKEAGENMKRANEIVAALVKTGGPYAQEAGNFLTKWGGQKAAEGPRAIERYTLGNKLMNDAKAALDKQDKKTALSNYESALKAYKQAVEYADPEAESAMLADSWYNMGQCYYFIASMMNNDIINFYKAGLAFAELAQKFPENQFAAKAAYLAYVFFAQVYQNSPEPRDYEANLYMDQLAFFVEKFPKDPQAPKLAYQVGEVLLSQKKFHRAADIYANIPTYSPYYERSCYMAGNCYWLAFLDLVIADPAKAQGEEGHKLVDRAISRLTEFIDWAAKQPFIDEKKEAEKKQWVALSRVRLGTIYADEFVKRPQQAIEVLKDFETLYPKEDKSFPEVVCVRVQAMAWTNQLPQAIKEMETILAKYRTHDPKAVSKAARTIGTACAAIYEKPTANLKPEDVEAYRQYAVRYLVLSIEVNAEQPFGEYVWLGDKLMVLKDYRNAAQTYAKGMAKWQQEIAGKVIAWATLGKIGDCYFEAQQWKPALDVYKQLDQYVKADKAKELAFKSKLGLCYESQGLWQQALDEAWEILNDRVPQGTPLWFEAKHHQIRCFLKLGQEENGWKNFAQTALFYWPEMGGPETKKLFLDTLDKELPGRKEEFNKMIQEIEKRK